MIMEEFFLLKNMRKKKKSNKTIEQRLWDAADQLRANSGLKSNQYSQPVLGLIFLRVFFSCGARHLISSQVGKEQTRPSHAVPQNSLPAWRRLRCSWVSRSTITGLKAGSCASTSSGSSPRTVSARRPAPPGRGASAPFAAHSAMS